MKHKFLSVAALLFLSACSNGDGLKTLEKESPTVGISAEQQGAEQLEVNPLPEDKPESQTKQKQANQTEEELIVQEPDLQEKSEPAKTLAADKILCGAKTLANLQQAG